MAEALALEEALAVLTREAALLEQREALDERLAIDASMMDITWRDEMPPHGSCSGCGSRLRCSGCWSVPCGSTRGSVARRSAPRSRRLPNHLLLHILKLRAAKKHVFLLK